MFFSQKLLLWRLWLLLLTVTGPWGPSPRFPCFMNVSQVTLFHLTLPTLTPLWLHGHRARLSGDTWSSCRGMWANWGVSWISLWPWSLQSVFSFSFLLYQMVMLSPTLPSNPVRMTCDLGKAPSLEPGRELDLNNGFLSLSSSHSPPPTQHLSLSLSVFALHTIPSIPPGCMHYPHGSHGLRVWMISPSIAGSPKALRYPSHLNKVSCGGAPRLAQRTGVPAARGRCSLCGRPTIRSRSQGSQPLTDAFFYKKQTELIRSMSLSN